MSVTLESSLNSLKLALAQFGTASAAGQAAAAPEANALPGTVATPHANTSSSISLAQSAERRLDLQRQLDSAYTAQAMLEVVGKNNAQIMGRLQNLKKVVVQATSEKIVQSERAFLISQFEGIRKSLLNDGAADVPPIAMLRSQIAGNTSQAAQAQANFTPQAVISTLQFK